MCSWRSWRRSEGRWRVVHDMGSRAGLVQVPQGGICSKACKEWFMTLVSCRCWAGPAGRNLFKDLYVTWFMTLVRCFYILNTWEDPVRQWRGAARGWKILHKFCAKFVHPHAAEWLRDHCLTFGDGICLSGGWDSRTHHIVYCLKKGGMLSDFVKVIMCNISMRMMPTMAKLVFLAAGVYLRSSCRTWSPGMWSGRTSASSFRLFLNLPIVNYCLTVRWL